MDDCAEATCNPDNLEDNTTCQDGREACFDLGISASVANCQQAAGVCASGDYTRCGDCVLACSVCSDDRTACSEGVTYCTARGGL